MGFNSGFKGLKYSTTENLRTGARSYELLRSTRKSLCTEVSEQPSSPIFEFRQLGCLRLEDGRPIECHETSEHNDKHMVHNNPKSKNLVHTAAIACNLASHTEPKWQQMPDNLKTTEPCAYGTANEIGIDNGSWRIRNKMLQNCDHRWGYLSACNNFITAKWFLTKFCTNVL